MFDRESKWGKYSAHQAGLDIASNWGMMHHGGLSSAATMSGMAQQTAAASSGMKYEAERSFRSFAQGPGGLSSGGLPGGKPYSYGHIGLSGASMYGGQQFSGNHMSNMGQNDLNCLAACAVSSSTALTCLPNGLLTQSHQNVSDSAQNMAAASAGSTMVGQHNNLPLPAHMAPSSSRSQSSPLNLIGMSSSSHSLSSSLSLSSDRLSSSSLLPPSAHNLNKMPDSRILHKETSPGSNNVSYSNNGTGSSSLSGTHNTSSPEISDNSLNHGSSGRSSTGNSVPDSTGSALMTQNNNTIISAMNDQNKSLDNSSSSDNESFRVPPKKRPHNVPEDEKDDNYWDKRKKNNDSAKRSREQRRMKEEHIALRVVYLEQENLQLRTEVSLLKNEIEKLRCMLYNS